MRQLASLIFAFSLRCCFQENLVESFILKCGSGQITVQWPNGTFKQCLHCAECHPGRGLYPHKCGDIVKFPAITECKKCDSGKTFSDTYDTSRCKPCHLCAAHEVITKKCTPSSDTKCKKACNSGYFFSMPQNVCKMCSHCCFDGFDEEQLQCLNQGFTAVNRYCSPRPDRTCNPGSPTGSVTSTVSLRSLLKHLDVKPVSQQLQYPKIALISSSPKHLDYEPASSKQDNKTTEVILALVGVIGFLVSLFKLLHKLGQMLEKRTNRQDNAQNVEGGCVEYEPSEGNQGGSRLQAPRLQEVQQNQGFESAPASTSQGSLTEIPHTGGFKESVPDVNVLPKDFGGEVPHRTEEKKADDSARVNILDNKDVQDDMSDTIAGKGYRKLEEAFKSSLNVREDVRHPLQKEPMAGYKQLQDEKY